MGVLLSGQAKLRDHVYAHQIVAAPPVDDHTARTVLDNELGLKQVVALILLSTFHLGTKYMLCDDAQVLIREVSATTCFKQNSLSRTVRAV